MDPPDPVQPDGSAPPATSEPELPPLPEPGEVLARTPAAPATPAPAAADLPALPEPNEVLAASPRAVPTPPQAASTSAAPDLPVLPEPGAVLAGAPLPWSPRPEAPAPPQQPPPPAAPAPAAAAPPAPAPAPAPRPATARAGRKSTTAIALGSGSDLSGAIWGDFAIEQRLACGDLGSRYRARQISADRIVELRILPAPLYQSADYRRRFPEVARAAGRIASPQVLGFLACGEHAGRLWLAGEHADGLDFARRLRKGWQPDWREALRLCAQAAAGLAAAHAQDLHHGALRPNDLVLTTSGQVKIAGFALLRPPSEAPDAYLAPEQVAGAPGDRRADLHALGCVLYELLCRRPAYAAGSAAALRELKLRGTPAPPRSLAPWLPEPVAALVMRLLDPDPVQRPDAAALAGELELLARLQAEAVPRSRRHLLLVGGLAAALSAILLWWLARPGPMPAGPAAAAPPPAPPAAIAPPTDPVPTAPASPPPEPPPPVPPPSLAAPAPAVPAKPAVPDVAAIERTAAALVASGEHLGPAADLARRLGQPLRIDRQGSRLLWRYGRWTFVIEDDLVLNAKDR